MEQFQIYCDGINHFKVNSGCIQYALFKSLCKKFSIFNYPQFVIHLIIVVKSFVVESLIFWSFSKILYKYFSVKMVICLTEWHGNTPYMDRVNLINCLHQYARISVELGGGGWINEFIDWSCTEWDRVFSPR